MRGSRWREKTGFLLGSEVKAPRDLHFPSLMPHGPDRGAGWVWPTVPRGEPGWEVQMLSFYSLGFCINVSGLVPRNFKLTFPEEKKSDFLITMCPSLISKVKERNINVKRTN